jgi:hypothetical protein
VDLIHRPQSIALNPDVNKCAEDHWSLAVSLRRGPVAKSLANPAAEAGARRLRVKIGGPRSRENTISNI